MNHACVLTSATLAAALMMAAAPAAAQSAAPAASGVAPMTPGERHDWERSHRLSKIIGTDVRTRSGEKIGDIRDLVVDNNGVIKLAIVSTGGFLGLGDRLHAVPWDVLALGPKDDRVLDIDKAHLKDAPGFTSRTWPNLGDEHWMTDNRRYYVH
ncbi:MAG: PRC-barrel domain-containing protein [Betaproteobacteria bacterium]